MTTKKSSPRPASLWDKVWLVAIFGSKEARGRWPTRRYFREANAKRYAERIAASGDAGVSSIWVAKPVATITPGYLYEMRV